MRKDIALVVSLLAVSIILLILIAPNHTGNVVLNSFSNGAPTKTITFTKAGWDNSTSINIPKGANIFYAYVVLHPIPINGHYPTNVKIDVGGNGVDWTNPGPLVSDQKISLLPFIGSLRGNIPIHVYSSTPGKIVLEKLVVSYAMPIKSVKKVTVVSNNQQASETPSEQQQFHAQNLIITKHLLYNGSFYDDFSNLSKVDLSVSQGITINDGKVVPSISSGKYVDAVVVSNKNPYPVHDVVVHIAPNQSVTGYKFMLSDGTVLPYCITKYGLDSKALWIKVPYIPANGETTVYMYQGDYKGPQNCSSIFVLYDNFNESYVNQNLWELSGSGSVSISPDGLHVSAHYSDSTGSSEQEKVTSRVAFSTPVEIFYTFKDPLTAAWQSGSAGVENSSTGGHIVIVSYKTSGDFSLQYSNNSQSHISENLVPLDTDKHFIEILFNPSKNFTFAFDNNVVKKAPISLSSVKFTVYTRNAYQSDKNTDVYIGYVYVINYTPNINVSIEKKPLPSQLSVWAYQGWSKRQSVVIFNPHNSTINNFQVKLNVNYQTGMNENFSDIRFATATGIKIPYWIENYTPGKHATVWVKVPQVLGDKGINLYMYYGNPNAKSQSNGTAVFIFFDDFNGKTNPGWYKSGVNTVSFSNSSIIINTYSPQSWSRSGLVWGPLPTPSTIEAYGGIVNADAEFSIVNTKDPYHNSYTVWITWQKQSGVWRVRDHYGSSSYGADYSSVSSNETLLRFDVLDNNTASAYINNVLQGTYGLVTVGDKYLVIGSDRAATSKWDWVFVKKYTIGINATLGHVESAPKGSAGVATLVSTKIPNPILKVYSISANLEGSGNVSFYLANSDLSKKIYLGTLTTSGTLETSNINIPFVSSGDHFVAYIYNVSLDSWNITYGYNVTKTIIKTSNLTVIPPKYFTFKVGSYIDFEVSDNTTVDSCWVTIEDSKLIGHYNNGLCNVSLPDTVRPNVYMASFCAVDDFNTLYCKHRVISITNSNLPRGRMRPIEVGVPGLHKINSTINVPMIIKSRATLDFGGHSINASIILRNETIIKSAGWVYHHHKVLLSLVANGVNITTVNRTIVPPHSYESNVLTAVHIKNNTISGAYAQVNFTVPLGYTKIKLWKHEDNGTWYQLPYTRVGNTIISPKITTFSDLVLTGLQASNWGSANNVNNTAYAPFSAPLKVGTSEMFNITSYDLKYPNGFIDPVYCGDYLAVSNSTYVHVYYLTNMSLAWDYETGKIYSISCDSKHIYVGSNTLYAFYYNGALDWNLTASSDFVAIKEYGNELVAVDSNIGTSGSAYLDVINTTDGHLINSTLLKSWGFNSGALAAGVTSLLVYDGRAFVSWGAPGNGYSNPTGYVYGVNLSNLSDMWSFNVGLTSQLVGVDNKLIVIGDNGNVYSLNVTNGYKIDNLTLKNYYNYEQKIRPATDGQYLYVGYLKYDIYFSQYYLMIAKINISDFDVTYKSFTLPYFDTMDYYTSALTFLDNGILYSGDYLSIFFDKNLNVLWWHGDSKDNTNVIGVSAYDGKIFELRYGDYSSESGFYVYSEDTEGPEINSNINSGTVKGWLNNVYVTAVDNSANINDVKSGVSDVFVSIDGKRILNLTNQLNSSYWYAPKIPVPNGVHTITFTAIDQWGNNNSISYQFTSNYNEPPIVVFESPKNNTCTLIPFAGFQVKLIDPTGIKEAYFVLNDTKYLLKFNSTLDRWVTNVSLGVGNYTAIFYASDNAGNSVQKHITFTVGNCNGFTSKSHIDSLSPLLVDTFNYTFDLGYCYGDNLYPLNSNGYINVLNLNNMEVTKLNEYANGSVSYFDNLAASGDNIFPISKGKYDISETINYYHYPDADKTVIYSHKLFEYKSSLLDLIVFGVYTWDSDSQEDVESANIVELNNVTNNSIIWTYKLPAPAYDTIHAYVSGDTVITNDEEGKAFLALNLTTGSLIANYTDEYEQNGLYYDLAVGKDTYVIYPTEKYTTMYVYNSYTNSKMWSIDLSKYSLSHPTIMIHNGKLFMLVDKKSIASITPEMSEWLYVFNVSNGKLLNTIKVSSSLVDEDGYLFAGKDNTIYIANSMLVNNLQYYRIYKIFLDTQKHWSIDIQDPYGLQSGFVCGDKLILGASMGLGSSYNYFVITDAIGNGKPTNLKVVIPKLPLIENVSKISGIDISIPSFYGIKSANITYKGMTFSLSRTSLGTYGIKITSTTQSKTLPVSIDILDNRNEVAHKTLDVTAVYPNEEQFNGELLNYWALPRYNLESTSSSSVPPTQITRTSHINWSTYVGSPINSKYGFTLYGDKIFTLSKKWISSTKYDIVLNIINKTNGNLISNFTVCQSEEGVNYPITCSVNAVIPHGNDVVVLATQYDSPDEVTNAIIMLYSDDGTLLHKQVANSFYFGSDALFNPDQFVVSKTFQMIGSSLQVTDYYLYAYDYNLKPIWSTKINVTPILDDKIVAAHGGILYVAVSEESYESQIRAYNIYTGDFLSNVTLQGQVNSCGFCSSCNKLICEYNYDSCTGLYCSPVVGDTHIAEITPQGDIAADYYLPNVTDFAIKGNDILLLHKDLEGNHYLDIYNLNGMSLIKSISLNFNATNIKTIGSRYFIKDSNGYYHEYDAKWGKFCTSFYAPYGLLMDEIFTRTYSNVNGEFLDKVPPKIVFDYPIDGMTYSRIALIKVNVTDNLNAVYKVYANIDNSNKNLTLVNIPGTHYYYNSSIDLSNGQHTITVYAYDYDGNLGTATETVNVVDKYPPEIKVLNPGKYNFGCVNYILLKVHDADGIKSLTGNVTYNTTVTTLHFVPVGNELYNATVHFCNAGDYLLHVRAEDPYDNVRVLDYPFKLIKANLNCTGNSLHVLYDVFPDKPYAGSKMVLYGRVCDGTQGVPDAPVWFFNDQIPVDAKLVKEWTFDSATRSNAYTALDGWQKQGDFDYNHELSWCESHPFDWYFTYGHLSKFALHMYNSFADPHGILYKDMNYNASAVSFYVRTAITPGYSAWIDAVVTLDNGVKIHYVLQESDTSMPSNTSTDYYFAAFGEPGIWRHIVIPVYEIEYELGLGQHNITKVSFELHSNGGPSSIGLSIDVDTIALYKYNFISTDNKGYFSYDTLAPNEVRKMNSTVHSIAMGTLLENSTLLDIQGNFGVSVNLSNNNIMPGTPVSVNGVAIYGNGNPLIKGTPVKVFVDGIVQAVSWDLIASYNFEDGSTAGWGYFGNSLGEKTNFGVKTAPDGNHYLDVETVNTNGWMSQSSTAFYLPQQPNYIDKITFSFDPIKTVADQIMYLAVEVDDNGLEKHLNYVLYSSRGIPSDNSQDKWIDVQGTPDKWNLYLIHPYKDGINFLSGKKIFRLIFDMYSRSGASSQEFGVDNLNIYVGKSTSLVDNGKYYFDKFNNKLFTPGGHWISVSITDQHGVTVTNRTYLQVLPVLINITEPLDGHSYSSHNLYLKAVSNSYMKSWSYKVDSNKWITLLPGSSGVEYTNITVPLSLSDGIHHIILNGTTLSGAYNSTSVTFIVDNMPPKVFIYHPENNSFIHSFSDEYLEFKAVDDVSKEITCNITDNSPIGVIHKYNYVVQNNTVVKLDMNFFEAPNAINVTCADQAGNIGFNETIFTVDTIPPLFYVSSTIKNGVTITPNNLNSVWHNGYISYVGNERNITFITKLDEFPLWLNGWKYRMPIETQYPQNLGGGYYSFKVDTKSLIANGEMRPDCSDIRLVAYYQNEVSQESVPEGSDLPSSPGSDYMSAELPFVVHGCNTDHTVISFGVNSSMFDAASKSNLQLDNVYLYFGNESAKNVASNSDMFSISSNELTNLGSADISSYTQYDNGVVALNYYSENDSFDVMYIVNGTIVSSNEITNIVCPNIYTISMASDNKDIYIVYAGDNFFDVLVLNQSLSPIAHYPLNVHVPRKISAAEINNGKLVVIGNDQPPFIVYNFAINFGGISLLSNYTIDGYFTEDYAKLFGSNLVLYNYTGSNMESYIYDITQKPSLVAHYTGEVYNIENNVVYLSRNDNQNTLLYKANLNSEPALVKSYSMPLGNISCYSNLCVADSYNGIALFNLNYSIAPLDVQTQDAPTWPLIYNDTIIFGQIASSKYSEGDVGGTGSTGYLTFGRIALPQPVLYGFTSLPTQPNDLALKWYKFVDSNGNVISTGTLTPYDGSTTTYNVTVNFNSDGVYYLFLYANDTASNLGTTIVKIVKNSTVPTIKYDELPSSDYYRLINYSVSNADECWFTIVNSLGGYYSNSIPCNGVLNISATDYGTGNFNVTIEGVSKYGIMGKVQLPVSIGCVNISRGFVYSPVSGFGSELNICRGNYIVNKPLIKLSQIATYGEASIPTINFNNSVFEGQGNLIVTSASNVNINFLNAKFTNTSLFNTSVLFEGTLSNISFYSDDNNPVDRVAVVCSGCNLNNVEFNDTFFVGKPSSVSNVLFNGKNMLFIRNAGGQSLSYNSGYGAYYIYNVTGTNLSLTLNNGAVVYLTSSPNVWSQSNVYLNVSDSIGVFINDTMGNIQVYNSSIKDNLVGIMLYGTYLTMGNSMLVGNKYMVYSMGGNSAIYGPWQVEKGTNILGGPYIGGNYWQTYGGYDVGDTNGSVPYRDTVYGVQINDEHPITNNTYHAAEYQDNGWYTQFSDYEHTMSTSAQPPKAYKLMFTVNSIAPPVVVGNKLFVVTPGTVKQLGIYRSNTRTQPYWLEAIDSNYGTVIWKHELDVNTPLKSTATVIPPSAQLTYHDGYICFAMGQLTEGGEQPLESCYNATNGNLVLHTNTVYDIEYKGKVISLNYQPSYYESPATMSYEISSLSNGSKIASNSASLGYSNIKLIPESVVFDGKELYGIISQDGDADSVFVLNVTNATLTGNAPINVISLHQFVNDAGSSSTVSAYSLTLIPQFKALPYTSLYNNSMYFIMSNSTSTNYWYEIMKVNPSGVISEVYKLPDEMNVSEFAIKDGIAYVSLYNKTTHGWYSINLSSEKTYNETIPGYGMQYFTLGENPTQNEVKQKFDEAFGVEVSKVPCDFSLSLNTVTRIIRFPGSSIYDINYFTSSPLESDVQGQELAPLSIAVSNNKTFVWDGNKVYVLGNRTVLPEIEVDINGMSAGKLISEYGGSIPSFETGPMYLLTIRVIDGASTTKSAIPNWPIKIVQTEGNNFIVSFNGKRVIGLNSTTDENGKYNLVILVPNYGYTSGYNITVSALGAKPVTIPFNGVNVIPSKMPSTFVPSYKKIRKDYGETYNLISDGMTLLDHAYIAVIPTFNHKRVYVYNITVESDKIVTSDQNLYCTDVMGNKPILFLNISNPNRYNVEVRSNGLDTFVGANKNGFKESSSNKASFIVGFVPVPLDNNYSIVISANGNSLKLKGCKTLYESQYISLPKSFDNVFNRLSDQMTQFLKLYSYWVNQVKYSMESKSNG